MGRAFRLRFVTLWSRSCDIAAGQAFGSLACPSAREHDSTLGQCLIKHHRRMSRRSSRRPCTISTCERSLKLVTTRRTSCRCCNGGTDPDSPPLDHVLAPFRGVHSAVGAPSARSDGRGTRHKDRFESLFTDTEREAARLTAGSIRLHAGRWKQPTHPRVLSGAIRSLRPAPWQLGSTEPLTRLPLAVV
jgi:hypothetical protein